MRPVDRTQKGANYLPKMGRPPNQPISKYNRVRAQGVMNAKKHTFKRRREFERA
jgi:hypothetical protein